MSSPMTICLDQQRRRDLVNSGANGIESAHVSRSDRKHVRVVLVRAWEHATRANFRITGGRRIRDVQIEHVKPVFASGFGLLDLTLNMAGDDSTYVLTVVDPNNPDQPPGDFDARFASVEFQFRRVSVADQDCAGEACPPELARPAPIIDYLAKDYSSFRRLMLDRLSQTLPAWGERRAADLGITVVEALAYLADHLSYFQDAVATEAYLNTARHRVSVRRHCRLVDYRLHEGCNARAWVFAEVEEFVSADGLTFFTQPNQSHRNQSRKPIRSTSDLQELEQADRIVFEPIQRVDRPSDQKMLYPTHNEIRFYTWGDNECCLPKGAISATIEAVRGAWVNPITDKNAAGVPQWKWEDDQLPKIGDLMLFEEVLGPQTGLVADADPQHRHVVRLTHVVKNIDRRPKPLVVIDSPQSANSPIKQKPQAAPPKKEAASYQSPHPTMPHPPTASFEEVPILEIAWDAADALPFSLCISTGGLKRVSVARGNILLVDHGLTFEVAKEHDLRREDSQVELPGLKAANDLASSACDAPAARLGNQPRLARPRRFNVVPFPHRWSGLQHLAGEADRFDQHGLPVSRPLGRPLTESVPYPDRQIQARTQSRGLARWQAERLAQRQRRQHSVAPPETTPYAAPDKELASDQAPTPVLQAELPKLFVDALIDQARAGRRLSPADHQAFRESAITPPKTESIPDFIGPAVYDLQPDPQQSRTSLTLTELAPSNAETTELQWVAQCDLLASGPQDRHFVVEIDDEGIVWLRFGDGQTGMIPRQGTKYDLRYRIGNGIAGNVGAEAITGVIGDQAEKVLSVRNPLPARGGVDPEPAATAKLLAPTAFRKRQLRAIAADDYAKLAAADDRVLRAVADLHWNGHGYEVQVAVDFKASALSGVDDVVTEERLIRQEIEAELSHYRRMAHDVRVVSAHEVPLKIALRIRVEPHVERGRVKMAVRRGLGNGEMPDGSPGFFHHDNLTFGQRIDVSAIIAHVRADIARECHVPGEVSIELREFRRLFGPKGNALAAGTLLLGPLEIARLDDDPAFPEHGQLELEIEGGR